MPPKEKRNREGRRVARDGANGRLVKAFQFRNVEDAEKWKPSA